MKKYFKQIGIGYLWMATILIIAIMFIAITSGSIGFITYKPFQTIRMYLLGGFIAGNLFYFRERII